MSDIRSAEDDALPWLEAVEDEDNPPAVSARKMLAALVLVLLGVAIVAGTLFWLGRQDRGSGPPQLIKAEAGPYKVRPDDPGGLDVAGDSGTAYATGAGEDSDAQLDTSKLGEVPEAADEPAAAWRRNQGAGRGRAAQAGGGSEPAATPPVAGAKGTMIQLGAYGSTAKAETAWRMLSSRFPAVGGLTKVVVPFSGGYRLRAQRDRRPRRRLPAARSSPAAKIVSWRSKMKAAIYGLSGPQLTDNERDFFRDADPAGYILFKRNCCDNEQLRRLNNDLQALSGRPDVPILIDQEGGRVARMQPPEWPAFPRAEAFAALYDLAPSSAIEATRVNARAIALTLRAAGINVNCLPVLDVRQPGATEIVGDRSLGGNPMQVAALGRAVLDGMASAGVVGVIKHIPGHGRALVDSHKELPVVSASDEELALDLEPFERLRWAPMGMVAHVVYTAWDAALPASLSPTGDRHDHSRAHRLRRPADDRRPRHARADRRHGLARRGRGRRRLRHRAALFGRHGGNGVGRRRHPRLVGRRRSAAGASDGGYAQRGRRHRFRRGRCQTRRLAGASLTEQRTSRRRSPGPAHQHCWLRWRSDSPGARPSTVAKDRRAGSAARHA